MTNPIDHLNPGVPDVTENKPAANHNRFTV